VQTSSSRYPDPDPDLERINKQYQANKQLVSENKLEAIGIPKRNLKHSKVFSLAAATIQNLQSTLKLPQLQECGLAYINNGIVRSIIDRSVYFINPERTDFIVEPNAELITGLDNEEKKEIKQQIKDDTLTGEDGQPLRIKDLTRKTVRANKRVMLKDRSDKLITSALVYSRGFLKIERFPKNEEWPIYGEPLALKHLSSLRVKNVMANEKTGIFEGIEYDDGKSTGSGTKYRSDQLMPAFHDDNNILVDSNYSGLSAVWPVLEAANVIEAIIGEDMPEVTRQLHAKFGIMYGGTSKKSTLRKLKEELEASTWLVHNEPGLTAEVHDLARDPMELMSVVDSLSKYMCMSMNLPQFLLFEDTANFATANQVMQVYKAGMLNRYRTWFRDVLEYYWYDPILADHLGIELKDVISAPIRIKAIFQDINFETRLEAVQGAEKYFNMGVMDEIDVAEDADREDLVNKLELKRAAMDADETESIKEVKQREQAEQTQRNAVELQKTRGNNKQPFF
jgi:hypothetical protein